MNDYCSKANFISYFRECVSSIGQDHPVKRVSWASTAPVQQVSVGAQGTPAAIHAGAVVVVAFVVVHIAVVVVVVVTFTIVAVGAVSEWWLWLYVRSWRLCLFAPL